MYHSNQYLDTKNRNTQTEQTGSYIQKIFLDVYRHLDARGFILEPMGREHIVNNMNGVGDWCQHFRFHGLRASPSTSYIFENYVPILFITFNTYVYRRVRYLRISAKLVDPRNTAFVIYEFENSSTSLDCIYRFLDDAEFNMYSVYYIHRYLEYPFEY